MEPSSLQKEWRRLWERVGALDAIVLQEGAPASVRDRAEGYRYLARLVAANLDLWIRRGDPDDPRVFWVNDSWGLPNADALYTSVPLRGDAVYELSGRRGSVHWLNFQVTASWFGTGAPMRVVAEVSGHELDADADGRFSLILGGPKRERNWLPLAPDASALTVRQFFYDWDHETRAEVEIRRLGAGPGTAALDPATLAKRLDTAASVMEATAALFPQRAIASRSHVANAFAKPTGASNELGIQRNVYAGGYFVLGPEEALLVEVPLPRCLYWGIQLGSFWMEPLDFANHQTSLNGHQAVVDPDGVFRAVVSAKDPGVANWLDTTGHSEGAMLIRWLDGDAAPRPTTKRVAFDEVWKALPDSTSKVAPEQRAEILERRRSHVARRYR